MQSPTAVKLARIIAVLLSILIVACRSESPSEPACRVDRDSIENISGDAVCIVRIDQLLLTVNPNRSKKLALPAGQTKGNETAQCTAHRAAWELTGFNVEVGNLLGQSEDGTLYYSCKLDAGFTGDIKDFPIPKWAKSKTSKITLVDPFTTTDKAWQEHMDLIFIRGMFNKTAD